MFRYKNKDVRWWMEQTRNRQEVLFTDKVYSILEEDEKNSVASVANAAAGQRKGWFEKLTPQRRDIMAPKLLEMIRYSILCEMTQVKIKERKLKKDEFRYELLVSFWFSLTKEERETICRTKWVQLDADKIIWVPFIVERTFSIKPVDWKEEKDGKFETYLQKLEVKANYIRQSYVLGANFRKIRKYLGQWTQKDIADLLNIEQNSVSRVESGQGTNEIIICALLEFYSRYVTLDDIFTPGYIVKRKEDRDRILDEKRSYRMITTELDKMVSSCLEQITKTLLGGSQTIKSSIPLTIVPKDKDTAELRKWVYSQEFTPDELSIIRKAVDDSRMK